MRQGLSDSRMSDDSSVLGPEPPAQCVRYASGVCERSGVGAMLSWVRPFG
jgi:hypothetical protein